MLFLSGMLSFLKILPVAKLTWNFIGVFSDCSQISGFFRTFFAFFRKFKDTAKISGFSGNSGQVGGLHSK
jgi:hypothetical protein